MSWNLRVFLSTAPTDYPFYTIKECYYDEDDRPTSWTKNPVSPCGETLEELREDIERFMKALTLPVLRDEDGVETA